MTASYSTTTTAGNSFSLQDAVNAMRAFKKLPKPDTLVMHPKTYEKASAAMGIPAGYELIPDVLLNDLVPQNDLQTRWVPPPAGRFTELTAEDECWARPLGLGRLETIDLGPVIYKINQRLTDWLQHEMLNPLPLSGLFAPYSSTISELPTIRKSLFY